MAETSKVGHGANAGLQLGPEGDRLIRQWEGLRLKAYRDTEGILTIGYGTTAASGVVFGPDRSTCTPPWRASTAPKSSG